MKKFIVLDCEATDTVMRKSGEVHPESSLVYDLGFLVADKSGAIYESYSFVNSDVICNQKLMKGAYYADKLPQYFANLGNDNKWYLADTLTIWKTLDYVCKKYNVKKIYAYNSRYDRLATQNTITHFSNGFRTFFTPYGVAWCDIWALAGSTICNTKKYVNWCFEYGFVSDKGNPQTSAEIVTRYLLGDTSFVEDHTALLDAEIELSILCKALSYKKKQPEKEGNGWRHAARIAKKLRLK